MYGDDAGSRKLLQEIKHKNRNRANRRHLSGPRDKERGTRGRAKKRRTGGRRTKQKSDDTDSIINDPPCNMKPLTRLIGTRKPILNNLASVRSTRRARSCDANGMTEDAVGLTDLQIHPGQQTAAGKVGNSHRWLF